MQSSESVVARRQRLSGFSLTRFSAVMLGVMMGATVGLHVEQGQGVSIRLGDAALANSTSHVQWTPNQERGRAGGSLPGGRRDDPQVATRLALLVPSNDAGLLTTMAQPTFSWQVEVDRPTVVEFVVFHPAQTTPLYRTEQVVDTAQLMQVTLPEAIALEPGIQYRWTVVASSPDGSSTYATSFIERTPIAEVPAPAPASSAVEQASIFAAAGIWYDAIATLLQAYQLDPGNAELEREAQGLIDQAMQTPLALNGSAH